MIEWKTKTESRKIAEEKQLPCHVSYSRCSFRLRTAHNILQEDQNARLEVSSHRDELRRRIPDVNLESSIELLW